MFPERTGIRTHSPEEAEIVLSFYEEEGYTHDSMECEQDFLEYPILTIDDDFDDMDITGCKEFYYRITDGTITVIDFDEWHSENLGTLAEIDVANSDEVFAFLMS